MQDSYQITHNWGDPREQQQKNGVIISNAVYREDNLTLWFRITYAGNSNSSKDKWILTPPKDLRKKLGKNWPKRSIIFNRVIEYLQSIEPSYLWKLNGKKFTNLEIDLSEIKGWLPTKLELLNSKLIWWKFTLPTKYCALALLVGFICSYLSKNVNLTWISPNTLSLVVLTSGFLAIGLLLRGIAKDYERNLMILAPIWMAKKNFNPRARAVELSLHYYSRRYILTLFFSLYLIIFG